MTITVIYGARRTGKSHFAEAFAKHFGCTYVIDDWSPTSGAQHSLLSNDTLVLTQWTPEAIKQYRGPAPWRHPDSNVRFISIAEAIRASNPNRLIPSDELILRAMAARPSGIHTYVIRNILASEHGFGRSLKTATVRRRLSIMERNGKVASKRWGAGCSIEWSIVR